MKFCCLLLQCGCHCLLSCLCYAHCLFYSLFDNDLTCTKIYLYFFSTKDGLFNVNVEIIYGNLIAWVILSGILKIMRNVCERLKLSTWMLTFSMFFDIFCVVCMYMRIKTTIFSCKIEINPFLLPSVNTDRQLGFTLLRVSYTTSPIFILIVAL